MQKGTIFSHSSLEAMALAAADRVILIANEAIKARGVFRIGLAGGSTPRRLYEILSSRKYIDQTNWSCWMVYFSDERVVPLTDERSNYAMAKGALLRSGQIKEGNVYMVPVHLGDADRVAAEYETQIRGSFKGDDMTVPRFDLILLGLGSDGHTASLFPEKQALHSVDRLVVESTPGILPPSVDRVTFTFPLINAARHVVFLVSGKDKKSVFDAAYRGLVDHDGQSVPANSVRPENGSLDWFVTEELLDAE
jgi:6-phosphogluconolactonase